MDVIGAGKLGSIRRQAVAILSVLILVFLLFLLQERRPAASNPAGRSRNEDTPELRGLRSEGNSLLRAGNYLAATRVYQTGYEKAMAQRKPRPAARFLTNLGGAHYGVFRYRDAIKTYLEARDLARAANDREILGALYVSLSSLYLEMGDLDAALESARQGLKLPADATAKYRPKLLIQCARIKEQQGESAQALGLLQEAIEAARTELDMATEAQAWNELGSALMEAGRLPSAERALLESFRLRKWSRGILYFNYESLGHLHYLQGDLSSASTFFDKALESARMTSPSAMWRAYYERGNVKLAQSRQQDAFADYAAALECVRRWRAEVIPADSFRVSSEVELHRVYSAFIELGGRLYAQTGLERFAAETFAAAEENRAASLRALWTGPDLTKRLPDEYWQALADLYKAEAGLVRGEANIEQASLQRLRLKVSEMEARAGLDLPNAADKWDTNEAGLLARTRRSLRASDVLLAFHLGDTASFLWAVTREGIELRQLPARAWFTDHVGSFVQAIREDSLRAAPLGSELYAQLFGGASRRMLDKPVWIVAPDGPLFELPFAALPEGAGRYVVERHAVKIVPGVSNVPGAAEPARTGPFVGIGDAIYNRADARYQKPLTGGSSPAPSIELARLVGSSREISSCARVWQSHGAEPVLLEGADATKENFIGALRRNPSIVHVAAHLLFPPQPASPGMLALALQPDGAMDLLSATEIAAMRFKLGLVVLNGCSSGRGAALPGAGLMGMTRAWLAAGAHAVIATRWPTADRDGGNLFPSLYGRVPGSPALRERQSFAELLQQAQVAELHAGGWRANPAHWAAYFCVERN